MFETTLSVCTPLGATGKRDLARRSLAGLCTLLLDEMTPVLAVKSQSTTSAHEVHHLIWALACNMHFEGSATTVPVTRSVVVPFGASSAGAHFPEKEAAQLSSCFLPST